MSNRVLAAFVKSAVNTAAIKQVEAADLVAVFGCMTSWQGKQAFATWRRGPASGYRDRMFRKDGTRRDGIKFRINYPAMPDDALLTRKEADLIAAYTLHETGHVIYTNNKVERITYGALYNPVQRLHMLANGFEDARMEATVIQYGARNARHQFQQLLGKITSDVPASWNPSNVADSPFAVALLGRDALGNGNTYTSQLLARIPEPQRSIYAQAVEWFATAPMGFDEDFWSYRMADKFLQLWDAMRKQEKGDQPEQPDQPEQGEDGKPEQGEPEPGDDQPEDGGQSDDGESDDQPEQPSQPGDDGEDGDEEGGAPAPYELDDDAEQAEQQVEQPPNAYGDSEGDTPESKDDGKPFTGRSDSGELNSPEPSIDDMIKRINKRTESDLDIKLSAFSPADRTTDIMDLFR
jgi:hypothetical protein